MHLTLETRMEREQETPTKRHLTELKERPSGWSVASDDMTPATAGWPPERLGNLAWGPSPVCSGSSRPRSTTASEPKPLWKKHLMAIRMRPQAVVEWRAGGPAGTCG